MTYTEEMLLTQPLTFEWDQGNKNKSIFKHRVTNQECEEAFFDTHKKILKDILHSNDEERYLLIGKTKKERLLFVVFTLRNNSVRVISSRDLNKKEKILYETKT